MRARAQLSLRQVGVSFGDRRVLDQVSFTVRPGEKAVVVGENGSGKSTLLRLLDGGLAPDEGEVLVSFPGSVARLAQTLPETYPVGPDDTVQDAVDLALAELRSLEAELRAAEAGLGAAGPDELAAYGTLLDRFEERGGYRADAETAASLDALGLGHLTPDRPLATLSGGEQARLALACVLSSGAELLLLDEPTNHLDRDAVDWLRGRLAAHRGTALVVTHDRSFLTGFATTVLEVDRDRRTVLRYGDGWAGYRSAKAAERRRREQEHLEWREEVARTEELVAAAGQRLAVTGKDPRQGFGKHRRSSENKLSGQVRTARRRLEELLREPVAAPPEPLRFGGRFTGAAPGADVLVELAGIRCGDRLAVDGLRIGTGERLLVSGPNGAGKTTLLRLLAGELAPDTGVVRRTGRVGHLAQELPHSPTRRTALAVWADGRPGPPEEHAGELLALGLLREEDLAVPVAALSAGQRRRLELALLVSRPVDLLVLDEPTNHLAPALVEELEEAVAAFPGAVVAVSHDREFRARFAGRRLELAGGRVAAG
ncbi:MULTISPECIES: ABC-F family ATP-binding cassette domain-containing protein [Streptomyces]|uniref:ABC-F family ATP-binding cassette domain-containing protein n=2 Tax=Streptomyces TaxID=1883 RepID=A0ABU4KIM1_9ACTN|nr:ABC-F family ATP-binding cassette domain-containing protein [Streptomyces roseolus]MDX2297145.1 ABC-F family ATP-binding cassette domain-containing protein [Streptomyces roseolus]